jgi:putative peptide zinc metalloprotease protein
VTEGIVSAPEEGRVYAGADGFVVKVLTPSGSRVKKGDPLLFCDAPELQAEIKVLTSNLNEVQARLRTAQAVSPIDVGSIRDELSRVNAKLERARERAAEMMVRSPADGIFILPAEEDWPGRSVHQGSPVGYVVDFSRTIVSVIANQTDIDKIRSDTERVEGILAESPGVVYPAEALLLLCRAAARWRSTPTAGRNRSRHRTKPLPPDRRPSKSSITWKSNCAEPGPGAWENASISGWSTSASRSTAG